MARIGLLVTASPFQFQQWETAADLAEAALAKGHQVSMFLYMDGVLSASRRQSLPGSQRLPRQRMAGLLERGARVLVCGTGAALRGLGAADVVEGVAIGGLPDFAAAVGEMDRLVSL